MAATPEEEAQGDEAGGGGTTAAPNEAEEPDEEEEPDDGFADCHEAAEEEDEEAMGRSGPGGIGAVGRYVDYSCSSPWEYLAADVEDFLRRCLRPPLPPPSSSSSSRWTGVEETSLVYDGAVYRLLLVRPSSFSPMMNPAGGAIMAAAAPPLTTMDAPALEDVGLDFEDGSADGSSRRRALALQRWFGAPAFLFCHRARAHKPPPSPPSPIASPTASPLPPTTDHEKGEQEHEEEDGVGMDRGEAGMVLSALTLALQGVGSGLPAFVPVGPRPLLPRRKGRRGGAGGDGARVLGGGYLEADDVLGYAAPAAECWAPAAATTTIARAGAGSVRRRGGGEGLDEDGEDDEEEEADVVVLRRLLAQNGGVGGGHQQSGGLVLPPAPAPLPATLAVGSGASRGMVASPPAVAPPPTSVRLETGKLRAAPEAFKTLDGLTDLFLAKLGFGGGNNGSTSSDERGSHSQLPASPPPPSSSSTSSTVQQQPRLAVHAEHRWTWDARPNRYDLAFVAWTSSSSAPAPSSSSTVAAASSGGGSAAAGGGRQYHHRPLVPGDWRLSAARARARQLQQQEEEHEAARREVLGLLYKALGTDEPEAEDAAGGAVVLPGAGTDPLAWLTLRVRWQAAAAGGTGEGASSSMSMRMRGAGLGPLFVDNAFYSDFQPLETAPQAWRLSAAFDADEVLLPSPSVSSSSVPLPSASVAPLAWRLRALLASYVAAQAVSPGTTMAELAREEEQRGGGLEAEAERAEEGRLAVSIASHLGPHMAALVRELLGRPPPSPKDVEDLAALLLPPSPSSTSPSGLAEEGEGEEGVKEQATPQQPPPLQEQPPQQQPPQQQQHGGTRSSLRPGAAMRAPMGGLVSLLAAAFGGLESLGGMARLWVQLVGGLRWGWDRGLAVPRMRPPLEQERSSDVDRSCCLLHQKLQVLDLCTQERRRQEKEQQQQQQRGRKRQSGPLSVVLEEDEPLSGPLPLSSSFSFATPPQSLGRPSSSGRQHGLPEEGAEVEEEEFFDTRVSEGGNTPHVMMATSPPPPSSPAPLSPPPPSSPPPPPPGEREGALEPVMVAAAAANANKSTGRFVSPSPQLLWMLAGGDAVVMRPQLQARCPLTEDGARQRQQLLQQARALEGNNNAALVAQLAMPELLSDMEAFKAANPGGVLADFCRWRAPQEWEPWVDDGPEHEDEEAEQEEEMRLVWRGQGRVRPRFFTSEAYVGGLGVAAVRALWKKARPVSAARQRPLFAATREGEAVLHYLETLSPAALLCQALAAAFHATLFALTHAQTPAVALPGTRATLQSLEGLVGEALERLHEEQLSAEAVLGGGGGGGGHGGGAGEGGAGSMGRTHAVSQGCLLACERVCAAVAALEDRLRRATSLLHKLPHQERLADALLPLLPLEASSASNALSASVPLVDEDERGAVLRLFTGGVGVGGKGEPSVTTTLLSSSSSSSSSSSEEEDGEEGQGQRAKEPLPGRKRGRRGRGRGGKGKDGAKGRRGKEDEEDEDELLHAYEEVMTRRAAAAAAAKREWGEAEAAPSSKQQSPDASAALVEKEAAAADGAGLEDTPSASSASSPAATEEEEEEEEAAASPPPPPVLPPPDTRTYVLRCQASQPFHRSPFLGGAATASPVVTSRLHATVDRHDDSVRLALAFAESEL